MNKKMIRGGWEWKRKKKEKKAGRGKGERIRRQGSPLGGDHADDWMRGSGMAGAENVPRGV